MSFPKPYAGYPDAKYHLVQWEAEGVVRVSMNKGPVNALSTALWQEIPKIFGTLHKDGDVRAVIFSGEGKCFTAGLDLNESSLTAIFDGPGDAARKALKMREHVVEFQAAISSLEKCEKPVIAAVHSYAFGAGIDLMTAADVRFAASDSKFSIKEVDVGLAADVGTLQRLPKGVGNHSLARELAYTARTFDVKEARELGLISRIVEGSHKEVVAEAIKVASVIATKSPIAVRGTKVQMNYARDHSVAEGLDYISVWNSVMLQTDDLPIAMQAALTKTTVPFPKL